MGASTNHEDMPNKTRGEDLMEVTTHQCTTHL